MDMDMDGHEWIWMDMNGYGWMHACMGMRAYTVLTCVRAYVRLSVRRSVGLSVCRSACLPVGRYVCMYAFVDLYIYVR